ncbi:DNA polymerase III subunit alpha [Bacteroidetes/Chlorobi group bacterium ChocPot_Mid]|nr:MAG: DNA polymerase III subunit alpha [Bacteroidetes/Chlorobi group bacterium ChocPot_Mid]
MFSLHVHSYFSFLQSTIKIEELVSFAKKSGSNYVSLTDTNGMYGLIQFFKIAKENNIKPILGVLIDDPKEKHSAIFIAKNNDGYAQLCRIITSRKLNEKFSLSELFNQSLENLFVLTSSLELLKKIKIDSSLKQNLFVELIVTEKQKRKTRLLYEFAKENQLKIVATHPAYFLSKEDFLLHKVLTAIKLNTTVANLEESQIIDEEYYLRTPEELSKTWKALPEALWNADKIAHESNVDLKIGDYKFPTFPLPQNESAFSLLWKIAFEGLTKRYMKITDQAIKRLQYELEVIDELGFSDYFLIVWDIIREAKSRGIIHIGRGSAANSLVSYCLGFTEVDPIKYNLYFERFLNRGRLSPPDVDLDFSWKERDAIIKYIFEKYGYDKVGMISTTVTFRARSAFREVAKAFGISESEISKYSKFIPWTSAQNLPNIAEKFPETRTLDFQNEPWKTIVNLASKLAGFPRHLSIHPSGLVITKEKITNYVAMEFAKNKGLGIVVTQPDMYSTEELGLIKIDLLSQRSLGVLKLVMNELNKIVTKEESEKIQIPIYNITQSQNM